MVVAANRRGKKLPRTGQKGAPWLMLLEDPAEAYARRDIRRMDGGLVACMIHSRRKKKRNSKGGGEDARLVDCFLFVCWFYHFTAAAKGIPC